MGAFQPRFERSPADPADRVTRMRFQELLFSASVLGAAIALNNRRHLQNVRRTRPLFQPVAGRLSARATLCVAVCPDPFAEHANILNRFDLTSFRTSSKISRMGQAQRPTCPNCGAPLVLALPPDGKGQRTFRCFDCDRPDPLKAERVIGWLKSELRPPI